MVQALPLSAGGDASHSGGCKTTKACAASDALQLENSKSWNKSIRKCEGASICVLFACYLRVICVLFACYLRVICVLFACYVRVICVLCACLLHGADTRQRCPKSSSVSSGIESYSALGYRCCGAKCATVFCFCICCTCKSQTRSSDAERHADH